MADTRSQYRRSGPALEGLDCALSCGTRRCPVGLIDISAGGATLALPAADPQSLVAPLQAASRAGLTLTLRAPTLPEPLAIPLRLMRHDLTANALVLGVAFPLGRRPEDLGASLQAMFNRRGALRVEPLAHQPVTVLLRTTENRLVGRGMLRDLSATGMGVLLPARIATRLQDHARLNLEFHLPTVPAPLWIDADVRYLQADQVPGDHHGTPDVGYLGLEFNREERQQRHFAAPLARWITERQIQNECGLLPHELEDDWQKTEGPLQTG